MSAAQFFIPHLTATVAGIAIPGAQFEFLQSGTTTPLTVYSDSGLTTPRTNPVVCNGAGALPITYLDNTKTYRVRIYDSEGALLDGGDIDPFIPGTVPDASVLQPYDDAASASASAASASASAASTSAINSASSASDAAISATNATSSAAAAASSATAAATSATQSATSAALSTTSYNSIAAAIAPGALNNATVNATTRAILAGLSHTLPAYLSEVGREGTFVWSSANLSTQVASDTLQGIYVAPSSDTTGASGAWIRQLGPDLWANAEWFGMSTIGTGAGNAIAANLAVTVAKLAGLKGVRIPSKDYPFDGALAMGSTTGLVIYARGARLFGTYPQFTTGAAASDITLIGGQFDETSGGLNTAAFDISGTRIRMDRTRFTRPLGGDPTYCGYFRSSSVECSWDGVSTVYWNGFFLEGTNHTFANGHHVGMGVGSDDCYVFKAANCVTSGIKIINPRVLNYATAVAFGSEVGTGNADDPTFQYGIENIQVQGLTTFGVERPVFIKPGSISTIDYRNGFVRNILIDGITMTDTGTVAQAGAQELLRFSCDRGNVVEFVTIKNAKFRGRAGQITSLVPYGVYFFWPHVGAQVGTMRDIEIEFEHLDSYGGAANGAAVSGYPSGTTTATGWPLSDIVHIEQQSSGFGVGARINILVKGNGCAASGVYIGPSLDDAVTIRSGSRLRNTCQAGTTGSGGIVSFSRMRIEDTVVVSGVGGGKRAIGASTVTGVNLYNAKKELRRLGSYAAGTGTGGNVVAFVAPRDMYLSDIDLVVSNTPAQSDTNYKTIVFTANGSNFLTVTTKLTGGIALTANTPLRLNSAVLNTANAFIAKGSTLLISLADTGTGVALNDLSAQLSYVPYGELS